MIFYYAHFNSTLQNIKYRKCYENLKILSNLKKCCVKNETFSSKMNLRYFINSYQMSILSSKTNSQKGGETLININQYFFPSVLDNIF